MRKLKLLVVLMVITISAASAEIMSDCWMVERHGWYITGYERITISSDTLDGKQIVKQDKVSKRWTESGDISARTYTAYVDKDYSPIKEMQRTETIGRDGKLISYRSVEAVYKESSVDCETDTNGNVKKNSYPIPGDVDLTAYFRLALNAVKVNVGDVIKTSGFSLTKFNVEHLSYKITGVEKLDISGKLCDTFYADCNDPRLNVRLWMREGGEIVKWSSPDGHIWSAYGSKAEAMEAFKNDPPDFSAIRVENPFDQRSLIKSLSVSFENVQDIELVKSYNGQKCKYNRDSKIVRYDVIARKFDKSKSLMLPIKDNSYKKWLKCEDNQEIAKLAVEIVGSEKNAFKAAMKIKQWVYENIEFDSKSKVSEDPVDVLRAKKGLCRHFSALYCALARAAGIPAKSVAGLLYSKSVFRGHAWNEVYVGEWVPVDSASPGTCELADAAYIKLAEDTIKVDEIQCPATIKAIILNYESDQSGIYY